MCREAREFAVSQMREAVEYLETVPESPHVGLVAVTHTGCRRRDGSVMFRLEAKPMLRLSDIKGKVKQQVWQAFDAKVDEQRKGLARNFLGNDPGSWEDYLKDF